MSSQIDVSKIADEAISAEVGAVKEATPTKRKAEETVEEVETKKARTDEPSEVPEEKEAEAPEEKAEAEEEETKEGEETTEKPEEEEAKEETTSEAASDKERDQARKIILSAFAKKEIENAEDKAKTVEEKIFDLKGSEKSEFLRFAYSVAFNVVSVDEFASALEDAEKEINIDDISEATKAKITEKVEGFIKSDDADFDFDALTVSSQ